MCPKLSHQDELILHRLRMTHTLLGHFCFLKAEDPPQCISRGNRLTVEHFLMRCFTFRNERRHYSKVASLDKLFSTIAAYEIMDLIEAFWFYC